VVTGAAVNESVYQWNLATGARTLVRTLPAANDWTLSGDGNTMASESGDVITVTNLGTGSVIARLTVPGSPAHPGQDVSLDYNGDRLIDSNRNGTAYVWDVAAKKIISHVPYHDKTNAALANLTFFPRLSPDGKTIIVFDNDNQKGPSSLWDVATGANITPDDPRWPKNDQGCTFSEDGRICATNATDNKTAYLWDIATRKLLLSVTDPQNVADGGVADVGPDDREVVTLGPVNSIFESTKLYDWDIP
jgi:WD40 repeat protein